MWSENERAMHARHAQNNQRTVPLFNSMDFEARPPMALSEQPDSVKLMVEIESCFICRPRALKLLEHRELPPDYPAVIESPLLIDHQTAHRPSPNSSCSTGRLELRPTPVSSKGLGLFDDRRTGKRASGSTVLSARHLRVSLTDSPSPQYRLNKIKK